MTKGAWWRQKLPVNMHKKENVNITEKPEESYGKREN